jgi:hypothetical protein
VIARRWLQALIAATALQLGVAGCSAPERLPAVPSASTARAAAMPPTPIRYLVSRDTSSFAAEAASALDKERAWLASQGQTGAMPPAYYLAISGGGDNGAYGAGSSTAGRLPGRDRSSRSSPESAPAR